MTNNKKYTKEKKSFVKDVIKSIKDFDKYEDFALESLGRTLCYILKIVAILVLAITCVSIYQFSQMFNTAIKYFENNIENVTYDNGILNINDNEKLVISDFEEYFGEIIIDTADSSDEQIEEYEENIKNKNNAIIILKDRVLLKSTKVAVATETKYEDLLNGYNIEKMDKQEILTYLYKNKLQMYFTIFAILYIYMFVVYLSSVIVDTLLLAIVAYILARMMKMNIRFGALFRIGAHALTLSIVLNFIYIIINGITGFKVQYFQTMYTAIAYVYIITVLFIIRADFIKKQIELEKIKSEQEKIHEELEMQKQKEDEENQERKNKEERQKQKEKEQSEEKDDSSNMGNKPEGSNA